MASIKPDSRLSSRTARAKLAVDKEAYWMVMEKGRSLGYRKGKTGGEWYARYYDPLMKPTKRYQHLGSADDFTDPNNETILSFTEAQTKARTWFDTAFTEATGKAIRTGKFTVADAVANYLVDRKRSGAKTASRMGCDFNAHVLPLLGEIAVERLTSKRIEDWMEAVAASPIRRRGKTGDAPTTDAEKRARKATANRIWTLLRAALNCAVAEKHCKKGAWTEVGAFRGTQVARRRFLSPAEQIRFVNACPSEDFRALIRAALFTGAREGELLRLAAHDFDPQKKQLFIEFSKDGHSRHVTLTEEGAAFFTERCTGLDPTDALFLRETYDRKDKKSRGLWTRPEISRMMKEVCIKAKLEELTFHELRHTYASGLVNAGVALVFVALQLGHRDIRMVEKHYGHLCQDAKSEAVRKSAPILGIHIPSGAILPLEIRA